MLIVECCYQRRLINGCYSQARTQGDVRGFKHPLWFPPFFVLACLLVWEIGHVRRYPYPVSGRKLTHIFFFWEKKEECWTPNLSPPPPPTQRRFQGWRGIPATDDLSSEGIHDLLFISQKLYGWRMDISEGCQPKNISVSRRIRNHGRYEHACHVV